MLKHRVIPILLWDGTNCVQSVQFKKPHRVVGSMMQSIQNMERRNIDEIIILDVNATLEKREPLFEELKEYTSHLFCPVTYGGGISKIEDVNKLIQECGVDKVALNSFLTSDQLAHKIIHKYGSQSIVASIDIRDNKIWSYKTDRSYSLCKIVDYIRYLENIDIGEVLLTSVDRNGTKKGYDTALCYDLEDYVKIPVILNGGCGVPEDMVKAIMFGADAVAASTMFLFSDVTPRDCAKVLKGAGLAARV